MGTCNLAGTWMGFPSNSFYAIIFTITESGGTYTANAVGWYVPALLGTDQASYTLTGTVTGGSFSLQSTSGSNSLTFTGTCSDDNDISGTLKGELMPGTTGTATVSCVRLDTTYSDSITGQWSGTTGAQSASLSIVQSGSSITGGVGSVTIPNQGQSITFDVSVSGSVTWPDFSMTLSDTNVQIGAQLSFSGSATTSPATLAGEIKEVGPLTLNASS